MNDDLFCPDCNNIMGSIEEVGDDGRVCCDTCDSQFYIWEIDSPFARRQDWERRGRPAPEDE